MAKRDPIPDALWLAETRKSISGCVEQFTRKEHSRAAARAIVYGVLDAIRESATGDEDGAINAYEFVQQVADEFAGAFLVHDGSRAPQAGKGAKNGQ